MVDAECNSFFRVVAADTMVALKIDKQVAKLVEIFVNYMAFEQIIAKVQKMALRQSSLEIRKFKPSNFIMFLRISS